MRNFKVDDKKRYKPQCMVRSTGHSGARFIFISLFCLSFIAVGLYLFGIHYKVYELNKDWTFLTSEIMTAYGLWFLFIGSITFYNSFKIFNSEQALKKNKRRYPKSPWLWDNLWDEKGVFFSFGKVFISHFTTLLFILGVFIPANYFVFFSNDESLYMKIVIVGFTAVFLWLVLFNFSKHLKYSKVSCSFQKFPFHLGESADVIITGLPEISRIIDASASLSFIGARETQGTGKSQSKTYYYKLYEDIKEISKRDIQSNAVFFKFDLPTDKQMSTDLIIKDREHFFWELRVVAKVSGVDFDFGFQLPIYAN